MPGDAVVQLRFLEPLDKYQHEKPYRLFVGKPDEADITNVSLETISNIPVHDVRGEEEKYELDEHGFQFVTYDPEFTAFHDEQQIEFQYLPQVKQMILEKVPYAEKVFVFDWRVWIPTK